jgi:hypothetical protein
MFGEKANKFDVVYLSNDTLPRRTKDMTSDAEFTVIQRVRNCPYGALQLDGSTDVSGLDVCQCLHAPCMEVPFKEKCCFVCHLKNI